MIIRPTPKIVFVFIVAFFLIGCLTALKVTISYYSTYKTAQVSLAEEYKKIVVNIANGLDRDAYRKVLERKLKDDENYRAIRSYMYDYHQKINALYIYTLLLEDNNGSKVMVTATPPEVPLGKVEATIPIEQIKELKQGQPTYTDIIYDQDYGTYLSVLAPVFDEHGEVLCAVGIDISAESLDQIGSHVINNNILILAVDVFFVVLLLLLVYFLRVWYKNRYRKELKDSEQMYITELGSMVDSLRTTRHDFNNHFHVIHGLLAMNLFNDAIQYLSSLQKETKILDLSLKVKHPALLVLFNSKWEVANSKNIKIEIEADRSDFPDIETTDLVKIFSNLIDNAIEATELLQKESRLIHILCKSLGSTYVFQVENTANLSLTEEASLFKKGFTTKTTTDDSGQQLRGNGLSIIKRIVEKYKGDLYHQYKNGKLLIQITIPTDYLNRG